MSDLDALLRGSEAWERLARQAREGSLPQTLGCFLPTALQDPFAERFAALALRGGEPCAGHPDLLRFGAPDQPPGIDLCRTLGGELSLAPVAAPFRLAVVFAADRLSPPAANGLLKVTEEPPPHGRILLLAERDQLLPTLRSRLAPYVFLAPEDIPPSSPPSTEEDWLRFLERRSAEGGRKSGSGDLLGELQSWIRHAVETRDWERADRLNRLIEILSGIPLAPSMAADLVVLTLGEGWQLDALFGPVREA